MTVSRPRRRATKQPATTAGGEEVTSPMPTVMATTAEKGKGKVADSRGSRFSILTDSGEDLKEESNPETNCANNARESLEINAEKSIPNSNSQSAPREERPKAKKDNGPKKILLLCLMRKCCRLYGR